MKISSWLFGLQKLYQTKINSQLGQHPKTNNNNLIFSQAKSQIDEEQLLRKALNNKQLSSAEQQHLANNPMLQTKIELKKLEKANLEARLKAAQSKAEVNGIVNDTIITSIETSKTNLTDANLSIEIANNLRLKYGNKNNASIKYDKKV